MDSDTASSFVVKSAFKEGKAEGGGFRCEFVLGRTLTQQGSQKGGKFYLGSLSQIFADRSGNSFCVAAAATWRNRSVSAERNRGRNRFLESNAIKQLQALLLAWPVCAIKCRGKNPPLLLFCQTTVRKSCLLFHRRPEEEEEEGGGDKKCMSVVASLLLRGGKRDLFSDSWLEEGKHVSFFFFVS